MSYVSYGYFTRGMRVHHSGRGRGTVSSPSPSEYQTVYVLFDNDPSGSIGVYKSNLTPTNVPEPGPKAAKVGDTIEITARYHRWYGRHARVTGLWHKGVSAVLATESRDIYFEDFRLIEAVPTTTTTTTSKDENMTQNNLPQVGDIVTFKPGFDHAGETAKVIAVNPNARKYPVQVEYAPETQHRSLKSIVEPERKFDFKVGDRIEAALGDSIIRGEVTYASPAGSLIEVKIDGTRSTTTIRAKSDFEVTKLIELPTKQFAQIRVNGTVLVLIGGKFVNPITNRTRTPRRVTEQVVNEGRDYEVLFEGLDA